MPQRSSWKGAPCPIGRAVDVLGDSWTLLIMRHAMLGTTRYDEFRGDLEIADNVLSTRLKQLVAAGLLARVPYRDSGRTRHEYRLTESGADTLPILQALANWGEAHTHTDDPHGPMRLIHRTCGQPAGNGFRCAHCKRKLTRETLAWLRPWRSTEPTPIAAVVPV